MYARRSLSAIVGGVLLLSCAPEKSSKEKRLERSNASLRQTNLDLQAQIAAIGPEGAGLKEIQSKLVETQQRLAASETLQTELSQQKSELEADIEALKGTNQGAKIIELRRLLRDKESELQAEKKNGKKLAADMDYYGTLIKSTLEPFWGLYISKGDYIQVGDAKCRLMIYPENEGQIIRALVCRDGKMQFERQQALTFDAVVDDQLEGKYGFGFQAQTQVNSCQRAPSYLAGSGTYHFERASRYGAATFAVGVRTDLDSQPVLLENAAVVYKSADCEDILARSANPGSGYTREQLENLDLAGKFCRFVAGETPFLVGCFEGANAFVPFY